jgi:ABC-type microcin C transport system permease subunit YejE
MRIYFFIAICSFVYRVSSTMSLSLTTFGNALGIAIFASAMYFLFSGTVNLLKKLGA